MVLTWDILIMKFWYVSGEQMILILKKWLTLQETNTQKKKDKSFNDNRYRDMSLSDKFTPKI